MRTCLGKKKLVVQLTVLLLAAGLGGVSYWYFTVYSAKQHDDQVIQSMLAVTKAVETNAQKTLATPTTLQGVGVKETKDVSYFPAVQRYEYFVCGDFRQNSLNSQSISISDGQKAFGEAAMKAQASDPRFKASTAVLLNSDKLQTLHRKGTNCYYSESSVAKFEYNHPLHVCGGKYTDSGPQEMVVGVSGRPVASISLINALGLVNPTGIDLKLVSHDYTIDITQAKIVDANCAPKSLSDVSVYDIVETYSSIEDPPRSVKLVRIIKDL